jgi:hypothetical protein
MNEVSKITILRKSWINLDTFHRTQLSMLVWGLLLISGGYLHNNFASSKAWGAPTILCVWAGLALLGLAVNYLLAPGFLSSGSIFVWVSLILVGLLSTWLILFPFNMEGKLYISSIWHLAFAVGYFVTGYFSDRRLLFLTLWEIAWAAIMYLMQVPKILVISDIINNQGYALGLASGIPLLIAALPFWKERRYKFFTRKAAN